MAFSKMITALAALTVCAQGAVIPSLVARDDCPVKYNQPAWITHEGGGNPICITKWEQGLRIAKIKAWKYFASGDNFKYQSPVAKLQFTYSDGSTAIIGATHAERLTEAGDISIDPDELITKFEVKHWAGDGLDESKNQKPGMIHITTSKGKDVLINDSYGHNGLAYTSLDVGGGILVAAPAFVDADYIYGIDFQFTPSKVASAYRHDMTFNMDDLQKVQTTPLSFISGEFCNPNNVSYAAPITSSHSHTTSVADLHASSYTFGTEISAKTDVKVPLLAEFEVTAKVSFSGEWSSSSTTTNSDTDAATWQLQPNIPPHNMADCVLKAGHATGDIPYTTTVTLTFEDGTTHDFKERGSLSASIFTANAAGGCTYRPIEAKDNATCSLPMSAQILNNHT